VTPTDLRQRQSLPLDAKIAMSKKRIREWAEHWNDEVYVAFSGGKDSSVLLHLVRAVLGAEVPAVFCDTGLEYPEVRSLVMITPNVVVIRPEMSYREVIEKHGYPVVSKKTSKGLRVLQNPTPKNAAVRHMYLTGEKRDGTLSPFFKVAKKWQYLVDAPFKISEKCCDVMKKNPAIEYERQTERKPFIGLLADDSRGRGQDYVKYGCNAYNNKRPRSTPLAFWTEQDILRFILQYGVPLASVYGRIEERDGRLVTTGEDRTGCVWCMFGAQYPGSDGLNRFQRLALTHPKIWRGVVEKMGLRGVLAHVGVPVDPPADAELEDLLS
jgi:3'-phosphoadenosine 5'-phosphosulfate sulfotransferase (PAPS reductase)/FAD synthetase